MAGSDDLRTALWLYQRLANDATLAGLGLAGVYVGDAPPGAAYPFARITLDVGLPTGGNGGLHVLSSMTWRVVVIDGASGNRAARSFEALRPLAERIIALLDGTADFTADLAMASVTRGGAVMRSYTEDGIDYREVGMLWRVIARAAD